MTLPTIRPCDPADLDALVVVFQRAVRETARADYDPAQIRAWSRVDREAWRMRLSRHATWVARIGEATAGFAVMAPDGHLDMLYVHPDHGRRGVARALVARAEASATAHGLDGLHTEASLTARPFFEAVGFRAVASETVFRYGQAFRRVRMRKDGLSARGDASRPAQPI